MQLDGCSRLIELIFHRIVTTPNNVVAFDESMLSGEIW